MERFVGLLSSFGDTILGETVGVCPVCPVPNVGASSYFPLPRTVYPQVGPLDPVDESSQHFYHCALFLWALVSVPALVLDSFLFLFGSVRSFRTFILLLSR